MALIDVDSDEMHVDSADRDAGIDERSVGSPDANRRLDDTDADVR